MSEETGVYYNMVLGPFRDDAEAYIAMLIMKGTATACDIPVQVYYPSDECGFPADANKDDEGAEYQLFHK